MLIEYPDEERKLVSKMPYKEEMDFIVGHAGRNNIISKLTVAQKGNTLLLYQYVEKHGSVLYDKISKMTDRPVHFVFGGTETEQREKIRALTEKSDNTILAIGDDGPGITQEQRELEMGYEGSDVYSFGLNAPL